MKGPAAEWQFKDVQSVDRDVVLSYFEPINDPLVLN